jgi:hypothetical protein
MTVSIDSVPPALWVRLDRAQRNLLAGLRAGDVVTVRVLGSPVAGQVLLDVGGITITAFARIPVATGQAIAVRIAPEHGGITLRPVPSVEIGGGVARGVLAPPDETRAVARAIESFAGNALLDLPEGEFPRTEAAVARIVTILKDLGIDPARAAEPGVLERVLVRYGVRVADGPATPPAEAPMPSNRGPFGESQSGRPNASRPESIVEPAVSLRPAANASALPVRNADVVPSGTEPAKAPAMSTPTPTRADAGRQPTPATVAVATRDVMHAAASAPRPAASSPPSGGVMSPAIAKPGPAGDVVGRSRPLPAPVDAGRSAANRIAEPAEYRDTQSTPIRNDEHATAPRLDGRAAVVAVESKFAASKLRARLTDDATRSSASEQSAVATARRALPRSESEVAVRDLPRTLESVQRDVVRAIRREGAGVLDSTPGGRPVGVADLESLFATVKQLSTHVERMALLNHFAGEETTFLEIPLWGQGSVHTMKIRIRDRRKRTKGADASADLRFDMFFDLAEMGRLRVNLLHHKSGVSVTFQAEDAAAARMIAADVTELRDTLDASGLRVHGLRVEHLPVIDPELEVIGDVVTLSRGAGMSVRG